MEKLINFLNNSITPYHAVENIEKELLSKGFKRLFEGDTWELKEKGSYYLIKDQTSIIAFKVGNPNRFNISATHTDSPCFKIKPNGIISGLFQVLNTEMYGGAILASWFDRPLSIAGRVIVKENDKYVSKIVSVDKDLLVIPNTCPHLNPEINNGFKYNLQSDLLPLFSVEKRFESVYQYLDKDADIVSSDLYVYNRAKATLVGASDEFILAPRIDNLECTAASLYAFLEANNENAINVLACFNNEEIGSSTKQGAASNLLADTLKRVMYALGKTEEDYLKALNDSVIVSADNAHSVHPNHPELSDPTNKVFMNEGVVIKRNANERYTTDAVSEAVIINACKKAGVPYQYYTNRSNQRGGGTLGAISSGKVSITSCDIGLAQLAMHSSTETAGAKDYEYMEKALKAFYESNFYRTSDHEFEIK
ncbi:MAG: M18 family aminopeptidase [Bacilli bacterium]|nr:M18 family aminopeptidase [Bacilli bacterium]